MARTSERCAAGWSASFALNAVGFRFGCLHPVTSHRLYSTLSLPIMLYGCELWTTSKTESLMLERVHRKTLRTIQGLPVRCPSVALSSLLGSRDISSFISQQQLTFITSIVSMSTNDLPRLILEQRLTNPSLSGIIPLWQQLLDKLCLPSFEQLISTQRGKASWKNSSNINQYTPQIIQLATVTSPSVNPPTIGPPPCTIDKPPPEPTSELECWLAVMAWRLMPRGFDEGSMAQSPATPPASCASLHLRTPPTSSCAAPPPAALNYSQTRPIPPPNVKSLLPDMNLDPDRFVDIMLGCVWIKDHTAQVFIVDFLDQLRAHRNALLLQPGPL